MSNIAKHSKSKERLNYKYPYFVPIDDGDEATIKHYKSNDVPIAHVALPGRMKHYYAVFDADTQEEANLMNRTFDNWAKQAERSKENMEKTETSYDVLREGGFDIPDNISVSDECVLRVTLEALNKYLGELSEEKLRLCEMVAYEEPQREVAEEMGISRRTLRDRKDRVLKELEKKMR